MLDDGSECKKEIHSVWCFIIVEMRLRFTHRSVARTFLANALARQLLSETVYYWARFTYAQRAAGVGSIVRVPFHWAGICIDQVSDNRTTDNWPRRKATRTATNVPTNSLWLKLWLRLFYASGSSYPEYPWEQFPSRAKWLGRGTAYR